MAMPLLRIITTEAVKKREGKGKEREDYEEEKIVGCGAFSDWNQLLLLWSCRLLVIIIFAVFFSSAKRANAGAAHGEEGASDAWFCGGQGFREADLFCAWERGGCWLGIHGMTKSIQEWVMEQVPESDQPHLSEMFKRQRRLKESLSPYAKGSIGF